MLLRSFTPSDAYGNLVLLGIPRLPRIKLKQFNGTFKTKTFKNMVPSSLAKLFLFETALARSIF